MSIYEYLWHIDFPEERNLIESEYIVFLIKLAKKMLGKSYRRILDLACGTGRYHKYLREDGFEVYGVDLNEELIRLAKKRNKGFEDYYKVEDMRSINYIEEFDVVLNWYTSFGYFSDEDNKLVLRNALRALRPKGILILDVPIAWREGIQIVEHGDDYVEISKSIKISKYTFNFHSRLFRRRGDNLEFVNELRVKLTVYPPKVLKQMLESIGFRFLYAFANRGTWLARSFDLADLVREGVRRLTWIVYRD